MPDPPSSKKPKAKSFHYASTKTDRKNKWEANKPADKSVNMGGRSYQAPRKLEINFDKSSRVDYLTGFGKRKAVRRTFGLAMQKLKDRKARLEKNKEDREEKKEKQDRDLEARRLNVLEHGDGDGIELDAEVEVRAAAAAASSASGKKYNHDSDDDDDSGSSSEVEVEITNYTDSSTVQNFGGDVTVEVSYGVPEDSDDEEEAKLLNSRIREPPTKGTNDSEQHYAGNVERYMKEIQSKGLPSKKRKEGKQVWKGKGQHGAQDMKGMGGGGGVKMAKKLMGRFETKVDDSKKGKGGGKKGKTVVKYQKGMKRKRGN
ncbi:hypothetical protein ScalyP_jg7406 [Parmales sp. scaly parma]|nr:hypothetical protein ScalyP_jg7406 [Parmales sp. scaly parma]